MKTDGEGGSTRRSLTLLAMLLAAPAPAQTTIRVNVDSGGAQANTISSEPSLSADARFVVFTSTASNLVSGDTNLYHDVFVRDIPNSTTERVSVGSGGAQGNNMSVNGSISGDGRFVAFASVASNLVSGDTNSFGDVFIRDRLSGTIERVSIGTSGAQGNGDSGRTSISADGRYVAFQSFASNLVSGDSNGTVDVFVRDRQSSTTQRVSVATGGAQGSNVSEAPSISADGRYVAFSSHANGLVIGDTNGAADVFVRDTLGGTTERVSVDSNGVQGNALSEFPSISADGRFVAFHSNASNLVSGDTNGHSDVFVHDRQSGTTMRVSVDSVGVQGNDNSYSALVSADGRFVAFESLANNLVGGDTNQRFDVFVRDLQGGATERVNIDTGGVEASAGNSHLPSISANGRYVAFVSGANNLVSGDTNGTDDIFLRDRLPSHTAFCFGDGFDTSHTTPCPCGNSGAPGNGCAHSFNASGANLTASGEPAVDDLELASSLAPATSFTLFMQHDAAGDFVFHDGVLCAGGTLIRLRGRNAIGGEATFPDPLWDSSITLSQRGGVFPSQGVRRYYSAWYRNASTSFCPPATANVTNGVYVDW